MLRKLTTLIIWTVLSIGSLTGASRWKEVTIPQPFAQFAFLDFADSLDGVLFSKSGVYARTTDGGKTWILDSASFAGEVTNVKYFGKGHCWIQTDSANYPSLFYSSDGKVWVQRRLPDSLRYMGPSCGFATEQKILINTGKAILGTSNGGVTWAKKYQAYGARHSIDFADSTTGIATFSNIGASGETYWCLTLRTTDGGSTWDTLKAGDTAYNDVHFYTPMRGTMRWSYTSMEAMWFRTGMAFTTDGGKSFHDLQTAATGAEDRLFPVSGVEFDASNKFIIAEDSRIKTGEGGFFFLVRNDAAGITILSFQSLSEQSNWILASGNRLFQSVDVPTEVNSRNDHQIVSAMRLDQNYPNPFNPSTTISFSLPSRSIVSLKIFDVMGRDIATLVSDEMPAGTYQRQWNASGFPSGVYFYRLQADAYTATKRLLLLK